MYLPVCLIKQCSFFCFTLGSPKVSLNRGSLFSRFAGCLCCALNFSCSYSCTALYWHSADKCSLYRIVPVREEIWWKVSIVGKNKSCRKVPAVSQFSSITYIKHIKYVFVNKWIKKSIITTSGPIIQLQDPPLLWMQIFFLILGRVKKC